MSKTLANKARKYLLKIKYYIIYIPCSEVPSSSMTDDPSENECFLQKEPTNISKEPNAIGYLLRADQRRRKDEATNIYNQFA